MQVLTSRQSRLLNHTRSSSPVPQLSAPTQISHYNRIATSVSSSASCSAALSSHWLPSIVHTLHKGSSLIARAGDAASTTTLEELNQDTFYSYLEKQGDTLIVVDFYTDWCGPCKVMLPELYKLQDEMPHIRIVKFNCNKQNKDLGKALNIRVAPTFHLYKNSQKVGEMTGAKIEKLKSLIEAALGESD